jgi:hypothetical protein
LINPSCSTCRRTLAFPSSSSVVPRVPGRAFGDVYRPVVDIHLQLPNGRKVFVPAIVDSGADDTTLPAALLQAHSIGWDKLKPAPVPFTQGVGGSVEQRVCPASGRYGGRLFCTRVLVVRELKIAVVGRSDFFQTFSVDFGPWNDDPPGVDIERRPWRSSNPASSADAQTQSAWSGSGGRCSWSRSVGSQDRPGSPTCAPRHTAGL